jgi:hypothetical protein
MGISSRQPSVSLMRTKLIIIVNAMLLALATACGGSESAPTGGAAATTEPAASALPQNGEPVELAPADFTKDIDNPYWPMAIGSRWVYRETNAEGAVQRVEVTVTDREKTIAGIDALVVHDQVTEKRELVEDTFDWYAQDSEGNVWYLGEDTTEYENGKPKSKEGSWEHGVDGAYAGIIVPANPVPGLSYREEYYKGHAEDEAKILSLSGTAKVPFGSFDGLMQTRNTTPLEPNLVEEKFYARGIGVVLALTISGGSDREELVSFTPG